MPTSPNKLSHFWQELKRRKVIRVITVYAAAAFVILELVDIVAPSLGLPDWTLNFIIILLCVGFIIAIILSWVYDMNPEGGIVKTEPAHHNKSEDNRASSKGWKIASYVSFVMIVALIILNIIPRNGKKEILEKSIAVLPFINDSANDSTTYFINGIVEEILLKLQAVKELSVISRNSVEKYRTPDRPSTPEIAKDLDVNYIVEGSGQKYGNTFVLRVQLIEARSDSHLWGESYQREIESTEVIIRIQSEIAKSIARELQAVITPEEKQLIEKIPTTNLTAYNFFQRGREEHWQYWMDNDNREALERAEEFYHKALNYDSTFAQAYTGMAWVYRDKNYWGTFFSEDFLDSVLILCNTALSYDDQLSEAYYLRGVYYRQMDDRDQALQELDKALKYNPNDWMAYYGIGDLYYSYDFVKSIDNYHKAISLHRGELLPQLIRRLGEEYRTSGFMGKAKFCFLEALKSDRDSALYYGELAHCEFDSGNFERGLELMKKRFVIDSSNMYNLFSIGTTCMFLDQPEEALKYFKKWHERSKTLSPFAVFGLHRIGWAYWQNGYREEAEYYFDEQIKNCNKVIEMRRVLYLSYREFYDLAAVYAFRGEKDRAIENLRNFNKLQVIPGFMMPFIRYDPFLDGIRDEPEFQQIVDDMEAKYQAEHERVRQWLEENDML